MPARDPRDVVYPQSALTIVQLAGEGHPSEVFEAVLDTGTGTGSGGIATSSAAARPTVSQPPPRRVVVAAKKLKKWKRTAGGSLAAERDWLLLFDHPNILSFRGTVVATVATAAAAAVPAVQHEHEHEPTGVEPVGAQELEPSAPASASVLTSGPALVLADNPEPEPLYVLSEYMPLGRLSDLLQAGPLPPRRAALYALGLASALAEMHGRTPPVMHRDLHSDNVLIADEHRAVLADLGAAKEWVAGVRHTEQLIHYRYIKPPEVLRRDPDPQVLGAVYGPPFDVWALCCMLVGMLLGLRFVETRDDSLRPADLAEAGRRAPALLLLMASMLHEQEAARPTAPEVAARIKAALRLLPE
jgi:serine/threonine protein kinase